MGLGNLVWRAALGMVSSVILGALLPLLIPTGTQCVWGRLAVFSTSFLVLSRPWIAKSSDQMKATPSPLPKPVICMMAARSPRHIRHKATGTRACREGNTLEYTLHVHPLR